MDQSKKSNEDMRKHPRVDIHLPAEYQILKAEVAEKKKGTFETKNISLGGLMFYSYSKLKQGQVLLVHLYVDKTPVEFSAKVVWSAEWPSPTDPKKAFAIGLQYFKITLEAVAKINEAASKVVLLKPKSKES
jgi:c-di-GMP-binding flagellar brake protein YcgR